jgi:hypothetical protein
MIKLFTYSIIMLADRFWKKITINWIHHTGLRGRLYYFQSVKDYVPKLTQNVPKLPDLPNVPKNYQSLNYDTGNLSDFRIEIHS